MNIEKVLNDKELTIKLEGRLDTNSVKELEKEMENLDGVESIIFDLDNLEYISSSGLRQILRSKKTVDNTKVINCNNEVYNVFNVTGFTDMMDIEKGLRKISIDNCELIGEGFYGKIYRLDPETVVKVYKIPDALEMIKKETEISKKAFVMGIPTAIPFDIVKVGDLYGSVFELINAESTVDCTKDEKELDEFAKKSADLLKEIHKKEIKKEEFPSRKEFIINAIKDNRQFFDKETVDKLISLIETIPDSKTLLHCDFHVKNIMSQDDELLLIDMVSLSYGHPIFEFASMYATYIAYTCVDKENTDKFLGIPADITEKLFNKIFKYYYEDKTDEELESIKYKLSIISFIQVVRNRAKYADQAFGLGKEELEYAINYLKENVSKIDSLKY